MIAKATLKDEVNAALTVALTGAIAALIVKGGGPISPGRIVQMTLSNPIPRNTKAKPRPAPATSDLVVAA